MICPASGPGTPTQPARCDDTAYGKGTGGQLRYRSVCRPAGSRTVWFAVAGSDNGLAEALAQQRAGARAPGATARRKIGGARRRSAPRPRSSCPVTRCCSRVEWSKQNLADARQEARDLQLRVTNAGTVYPAPRRAPSPRRDWIGAGLPDYPWIFGTDGEYTAFAAVAAGQFAPSRTTCGRCATSATSSTSAAARSCTRCVPTGRSTSARTPTPATPTRP